MPPRFEGVQSMSDVPVSSRDLAQSIISRAQAQMAPSSVPYGDQVRRALPADIAGAMQEVDTEFATADVNFSEAPVDVPLMVKPYPTPDSWERTFTRGQTMFVSRLRGVGNNGMQTVASVPVLNTLQERRSRLAALPIVSAYGGGAPTGGGGGTAGMTLMAGRQSSSLRFATRGADAQLISLTAVDANEFATKWDMLGNLTSGVVGATHAAEPMFNVAAMGLGESDVTNLFADQLMPGEKLFYHVGMYERIGLSRIGYGSAAALGGASRLGPYLQIRAFTSAMQPQHNTGADGVPVMSDIDYIERERHIACTWIDYGWDDEFQRPKRLDTAAREGRQELIESVPQLVYDAYMQGHVYPVGIVKTRLAQRETADRRLAAHFDTKLYQAIKHVKVFNFIWGEQ